ncbi:Hpt domain-containing protein [Oxalobacteraceae bacterium]|nr:Hpt domain-containing protein [Oxalobacteraceae bacterium]
MPSTPAARPSSAAKAIPPAPQDAALPAAQATHPRSPPLPAPMPDTVGMVAGASAGATSPPGVINRRALDNIRALSSANGAALLERVLHAYIDDTPSHLQALRQAVAAANTASLRRVAHSLKSSSANVGADLLAQLSRDMEALGRDEHTDGAAALLSVMEREFKAVHAALNTILEKES